MLFLFQMTRAVRRRFTPKLEIKGVFFMERADNISVFGAKIPDIVADFAEKNCEKREALGVDLFEEIEADTCLPCDERRI